MIDSLYNQKVSIKPFYIAFNLYFIEYDEDALNTPFASILFSLPILDLFGSSLFKDTEKGQA